MEYGDGRGVLSPITWYGRQDYFLVRIVLWPRIWHRMKGVQQTNLLYGLNFLSLRHFLSIFFHSCMDFPCDTASTSSLSQFLSRFMLPMRYVYAGNIFVLPWGDG